MAARSKSEGWTVTFDIPRSRWSALGEWETEERRASKRAWLRRSLGKKTFAQAKRNKTVWKVNRFVLLVGVCDPDGIDHSPALYACEVAKPLVDAGTDAKLWPDDDAAHRADTTYFTMRDQWHDGQYHVMFIVLPLPSGFDLHHSLDVYQTRQGAPAANLTFNVPHKLWLTSNFNDSDLIARQKGYGTYGSEQRFLGGVSPENRKALRGNLMAFAMKRWGDCSRISMDGEYFTVAAVSYPSENDSDPDNASETISCLLGAGMYLNRLPSMTGKCAEVSVYKDPAKSPPSYHGVRLSLYRRDRNLADVISMLVKKAWEGR